MQLEFLRETFLREIGVMQSKGEEVAETGFVAAGGGAARWLALMPGAACEMEMDGWTFQLTYYIFTNFSPTSLD